VDVGGTSIKILATAQQADQDSIRSTPDAEADGQQSEGSGRRLGWVVSIGYGAGEGWEAHEGAKNLGRGWVGFDFKSAFSRPVRVINDAAMQALGSKKGRMLFLGLGTDSARH
jgi:polyphosphate glucokinase